MRAFEYLRSPSRIWAIEEGAWQEMITIAKGENLTLESIEASLGTLNNKSKDANVTAEGVAVIPVIGPIVKYGNLFSSVSGATSVSKLTTDFNAALDNPDVKAILFDIDSPGGEANGINEFAEQIYQARGTKPIEAYVSGQGCSAAYWIASACDKIWKDETATTGSIGVAAVVKDSDGVDEKAGVKTYKFVSEGSENKRPDLDTDEGKGVVMQNLNEFAQIFRSKVARNRSNDNTSLTPRDVIEKFNRGGVLMGQAAVNAGLADGISSYKEVLNNLVTRSGEKPLYELQENIMDITNENADAVAVSTQSEEALTALQTQIQELTSEKATIETTLQSQIEELQSKFEAMAQTKVSLQDENLSLKAEAQAGEYAGKMNPAQKPLFVSEYIQRAKDDDASPLADGKTRLGNFLAMWEATEEHGLTEEEVQPDQKELASDAGNDDKDGIAQVIEAGRAYAQNQNRKTHAVT